MPDYIRSISEAQNRTFEDNLRDLINVVEGSRIEYDPSHQNHSPIQEMERNSGRVSDGFNARYTITDEDTDVQYISTASSRMYNDWLARYLYEAAHNTRKECVLDEDVLDERINNELDDFLAEFAPKGAT